jgi:26S proteasome regulatory subunit N1
MTQDSNDTVPEEDSALVSELQLLSLRLQESNSSLYIPALEQLKTLIKSSTSSMTSVPKPLKYLKDHYGPLREVYQKWKDGKEKKFLADILSVLSMSYGDSEKRDSLRFRLLGTLESAESWGHEYVRHLSMELMAEYASLVEAGKETDVVLKVAKEIVPFFLKHNAEADACDLLLELEQVDKLVQFVDKNTFERVCLYILRYFCCLKGLVVFLLCHIQMISLYLRLRMQFTQRWRDFLRLCKWL